MSVRSHDELPAVDGSRLCLPCGLCCQGLLHNRAKLGEDEAGTARRLGLPVYVEEGEGPVFSLPCPRHRQNRCEVYEERPRACHTYQCRVLQRYLGGEITLESALRTVERARELIRALGDPAPGTSVWQLLSQRLRSTGEDADPEEVQIDLAALLVLCRRDFGSGAKGRVLLS